MTLPNPGVSLSILQIYNEAQAYPSGTWYNRGTNLGAYRGVQWWQDNTATGFFPSSNISINDFYSKRPTTPVTAGSAYYVNSGNFTSPFNSAGQFTVPLYSTLTVTTRGGGGGGAGGSGNAVSGSAGSPGGTSYFGSINSAPGGDGGAVNGNNVAAPAGAGSDGVPAGGDGGTANGPGYQGGKGGAGGKTTTVLTNPISGGSGPSVGSVITATPGAGGSGGGGGNGLVYPFVYTSSNGNPGGSGYIEVSWS